MDEYEIFLDELLDEYIVKLAYHANNIQTRIDSYIQIQARTLTAEQLASLITSQSSTILAEVDAGKNAIYSMLNEAITNAAQSGVTDVQRENTTEDDLWKWTLESGNPCPDCVSRSRMEPQTYQFWETVGLPKAGATICGKNCKCVLDKTS